MHWISPVHPNTATVATALALAEREAASGPELLTALVIGCDLASRLGLDMEEIDDLKLAVSEACNNCIQFAHAGDEILITNAIYPDRLVVTVRDRVDASAEGITQRRLGAAKEGGLGVFLIRTLMDEVSYETDARTGSRLTMTKRLKKS